MFLSGRPSHFYHCTQHVLEAAILGTIEIPVPLQGQVPVRIYLYNPVDNILPCRIKRQDHISFTHFLLLS